MKMKRILILLPLLLLLLKSNGLLAITSVHSSDRQGETTAIIKSSCPLAKEILIPSDENFNSSIRLNEMQYSTIQHSKKNKKYFSGNISFLSFIISSYQYSCYCWRRQGRINFSPLYIACRQLLI